VRREAEAWCGPMETGTKTDWLKALTILLVMVGIFYTANFVSGDTAPRKLIRIAIEIAGFAVLALGYRLWISRGKKQISGRRWIIFFAILILGLPAAAFFLPHFFGRHPSIGDAYVRFASSSVAESIPALVVVLTVGYVILWSYRRNKQ